MSRCSYLYFRNLKEDANKQQILDEMKTRLENKNICPKCHKKAIWKKIERFIVYNEKDEIVGFKDYSNLYNCIKECQNCNYEHYSL
jgi:hypothetical protein